MYILIHIAVMVNMRQTIAVMGMILWPFFSCINTKYDEKHAHITNYALQPNS